MPSYDVCSIRSYRKSVSFQFSPSTENWPDKRYRTTPLRGLFTRMKGGFYHDGRFATLGDVVEHYDRVLNLDTEKMDMVEYLKSL